MNSVIDRTLTDLVENVGSLPPVAARIVALTSQPDCGMDALARVIELDPAMTLRFLALANCAASAPRCPIRRVKEALVRLGLRRTRDVALLMGMHDLVPTEGCWGGIDAVSLWRFTLATAGACKCLAGEDPEPDPEDAWLTGLLHGIGIPLLARQAPAAMTSASALAAAEELSLAAAENRVLGFHHGHLAARLLARWQVPRDIAAAVADGLDQATASSSPLARNLLLARRFVRHLGYGESGDHDSVPAPGDLLLERHQWRKLTRTVAHLVRETAGIIDLELSDHNLGPALDLTRRAAVRVGLQGMDDALARQDLEEDSRAARKIQRRMLPTACSSPPGYDIATVNLPGRRVSGDCFDFPPTVSGDFALMIADVSGRGMPAALLASNLQACLRALSGVIPTPDLLLGAVSQALLEASDEEHYATMFLAHMEAPTGRLTYVSAGHVPVPLLGANRQITWLEAEAPPLGLFPGTTYQVRHEQLEPGDTLILYTDGITEATDQAGREFGRRKLVQAALAAPRHSPVAIQESIIRAVATHVRIGNRGEDSSPPTQDHYQDDRTLVVLRRLL